MKNLNKMFMDIAVLTAEQSNCVKYQVGCVIVKDKRVILQGYNGTVSGLVNCCDRFDADNYDRTEHTKWSTAVEVHAEMNIITYAARRGIALDGTTMYATLKPCNNCLKHVVSAGIKKVVYLDHFKDKNEQSDASKLEESIELIQFQHLDKK